MANFLHRLQPCFWTQCTCSSLFWKGSKNSIAGCRDLVRNANHLNLPKATCPKKAMESVEPTQGQHFLCNGSFANEQSFFFPEIQGNLKSSVQQADDVYTGADMQRCV